MQHSRALASDVNDTDTLQQHEAQLSSCVAKWSEKIINVKKLCLKHKIVVQYLDERAVQVAGMWAWGGYPRGKAGCLSPSWAAGRPHPSRLHSPPRRTSHSARHRLHTGTWKMLHWLACHCCSQLHISTKVVPLQSSLKCWSQKHPPPLQNCFVQKSSSVVGCALLTRVLFEDNVGNKYCNFKLTMSLSSYNTLV